MAGFPERQHDRARVRRLSRLLVVGAMLLMADGVDHPVEAAELSPGISQLYTSVSINPPTAEFMTVCYGFVCRRRESLDFTSADRAALGRFGGRPLIGRCGTPGCAEGGGLVRSPHGIDPRN